MTALGDQQSEKASTKNVSKNVTGNWNYSSYWIELLYKVQVRNTGFSSETRVIRIVDCNNIIAAAA